MFNQAQLLTAKPVLYVCNVEESKAAAGNSQSDRVAQMAAAQGAASVVISARIEEEISQLSEEEAVMFLEEPSYQLTAIAATAVRLVRFDSATYLATLK